MTCSESVVKYAAIMDPFGSSLGIKAELESRGITPVAILGSKRIPKGYTFNKNDWKHIIPHSSAESVAKALLSLDKNFLPVFDGVETGTIKAAILRDALRSLDAISPGSVGRLALARRDKTELSVVLDGLVPEQVSVTSYEDALQAASRIGFPVVIKPNRNAGGAGVKLCSNPSQVKKAYTAIGLGKGKKNIMNEVDTSVIVQEALRGQERAFNGVRLSSGKVIFTGIWEYDREAVSFSEKKYRADRLLDPGAKELVFLRERVVEAVTRLDLVGPFHLEMIGKYIIDFGARLCGVNLPFLEKIGTNLNPYQVIVYSYLNPDVLDDVPEVYTLNRSVAAVYVTSEGNATASHRKKEELERLKQAGRIVDYTFYFPEGKKLNKTEDTDGVVASVFVSVDSVEEREEIVALVTQWNLNKEFETPLSR